MRVLPFISIAHKLDYQIRLCVLLGANLIAQFSKQMPTPRILVVDDEITVLKYMVTILRRHGYEVHSASNASAALQTAEELSCGLNLLITDVPMPGVSGDELERSLRRICPYVDVLVVSGALQEGNKGLVNCTVLKKPFLPTALTAAVSEILSSQIH